ncbi:MAG: FtsX-like permease family protein [Saccharofermentans sp.]|nr:FtsX-like permease family protein [Saccharofermentans sp.]
MKPYAKTILRSIRMTLPRFIAIFAIIALGVGFFAGLKVTTPSFVRTADVYTKEYAMFDFKFLSTIGFEQEDIDEIAKRTNCVVEGSYTADCAAFLGDTAGADTVRFLSITKNVNKLKLESGRMPEKPDEIVIDGYKASSAHIGEKLVIADETSESARKMFKFKEYTVVGTARTPVYMNFQRGTSDEGSGTVSYYVCALPGAFDSEYFTEAYLYADTGLYIYSDEYKDWAKTAEEQYGDIVEDVIGKRFEKLLKDEYQKLYDGFDEFNEEIGDAWDEITDGQKELDDGKKELEDAQKEINDNRKKLADAKKTLDSTSKKLKDANKELTSAKVLLNAGKSQLDKGKKELDGYKSQLDAGQKAIDDARTQLSTARSQTADGIRELRSSIPTLESSVSSVQAGITNYEESLANETDPDEIARLEDLIEEQKKKKAELEKKLSEARAKLTELEQLQGTFDGQEAQINAQQEQLDAQVAVYNDSLAKYQTEKAKYDKSLEQYNKGKAEYDDGLKKYNDGLKKYKDGVKKLDDAQKEVDDGWKEYHDGVFELWRGYSEFAYAADTTFRSELVYGYVLLDSVDPPDTYTLGRDKNTGYVCFDNDSKIVDGIAAVFPIFFFAIAALVCSTTMSRMVSDERGIIGTMRALGFSDTAIVMKYAIYAGSASVLGGVLGFMGGTKLFPAVIWEVYAMMYGFTTLEFATSIPLFILSLGVALICTVGVSVVTAMSALTGMPAELIRPKAPLPGKRILLERIGFIWTRMKFLHKVSARNVFRFKKRMWMMIVGIAGCTALLLTAFGLYDSICNVVNIQYDDIMKYDLQVMFDDKYRQYEIEDAAAAASANAGINCEYAVVKDDTAKNNGSGYVRDLEMFISDDPNTSLIFGLNDVKTGESLSWPADGEVAVSGKLAEKNNVKAGDYITLLYGDDEHEVTLKVGSVFTNYTFHYVMMTPATYKEAFGKPYTPETVLFKTSTKTSADSYKVASYLTDNYDIKTWSSTNDSRESFAKTMERMNYVIVLVITCAAALAFIVLFNLNNINITERIREIATLKVMGFNKRETGAYVTRENVILVLLGFVVGLPLGFLLHRYVMAQIAMDMVTYQVRIVPLSYFYSLAFVLLFSTIVNLIMRAKIEKIDMAESLKSAE